MSAVLRIGLIGLWVVVVVMSVAFPGEGRARPGGCVARDLAERDEGDADVAQLLEQAVQGGLVDHGATEDGDAVVLVGEAQSVEPCRPTGPEMSLDANFVLLDAGVIRRRTAAGGVGGAVVCGHTRTIGTDLVTRHHHVW